MVDFLHDPLLQPNPQGALGRYTTDTYRLMNNTSVVATDGLMRLGYDEYEVRGTEVEAMWERAHALGLGSVLWGSSLASGDAQWVC